MVGEGSLLDVVFVHGLDGDAHRSWSSKRYGSFWPAWLAEDVDGLSVWSLGYDAASSRWLGHAMPIQDRAINLLAQLESHGIGQRPLCFVTHSMGGLVVKEMLLHAADGRADYSEFAAAARGVVFLATPHAGSEVVTKAVVEALGIVYRKTPAVDALARNAAHLRQLNTRYRNWVVDPTVDIRHKIFYETRATKSVHVVDAGSADPAIPGQTPIPVDANHIDICKPARRSDLVYGQVRHFITGIVEALEAGSPDPGHLRTLDPAGPHQPEQESGRPVAVENIGDESAALNAEFASTGEAGARARPAHVTKSDHKVALGKLSLIRVRSAFRGGWCPRLTMARRVAVVLVVCLVLAGSVWVVLRDTNSRSPSPGVVRAVKMSAAVSNESYRLVFPVNNGLANEQSVERLQVIISFYGPPCAELPPVVIYEVGDVVVAEPSGAITQGAVSAENGPAAGFKVPVSGLINYGCGWNQVQLSFAPPGAILSRLATTPIAIDIPREIGVTYRRMPDRGPAEKRLAMPTLEELSEEQIVAFRVIAKVGDADTIESCFLIARSAASGPQDCDYKLRGNAVFWRQTAVSEGEVKYER